MNRLFKIIKYVLLIGLPLVLLGSLWAERFYPERPAFDWMFSIALAGLVGIGTNTIAIRMLFRPLRPTVFGRQGLIPRNKPAIARNVAAETEKRLLNVDTIMRHIKRGRIVEQTIESAVAAAERYMTREENRRAVADLVLRYYNRYADRLFTWLTRAAEGWLSELARRPGAVDRIWALVKPRLKAFFESDELKHQTSTWILQHLVARTPELSRLLGQALDRYIDDQASWKKLVLQGVRKLSGIEQREIERMLDDFFSNPGTYGMVVGLVEDNLAAIESYFEQEQVRARVQQLQQWLEEAVLSATRTRAIPALRERIDRWLAGDDAWQEIDCRLRGLLDTAPAALQRFLQRPENVTRIQNAIPDVIQRLNIRQIVADNIEGQRTEEFERMIMKIAGENLAAIEVLGGLLGMLAGLALHDPRYLLLLPAGIAALLALEYGLTALQRFSTGSHRQDS